MKKLVITLTVLITFSFATKAQVSLGGGLAYNYVFAGLSNVGLDLRGEYAPSSDYSSYYGNVAFFLPNSITGTTYATASSSTTTPQQIEVADKVTWSMINISVGYKKYFAGAYDDEFNFYGAVGVGLLFAPLTYKITGDYDDSKYNLSIANFDSSIPGTKETLGNATMSGALGVELELKRDLYLTAETALVLPATGYNSRTGPTSDYDIGGAFRASAGIKYILN